MGRFRLAFVVSSCQRYNQLATSKLVSYLLYIIKLKMNYSVQLVLLICALISSLYSAPIDDEILTTTIPSSSSSLPSEKETLLADDKNVTEENKEVVNEESSTIGISPSADSVSETAPRIVLEEDIAFLMPKTTTSKILSTETTSSADNNDDTIIISKPIDAQPVVTTTATPISVGEESDVSNSNGPSTPAPTETTSETDLRPIIVNEMPSVSLFTSKMPFVLTCEAKNPSSSEVFFTKPIKYSWNKNGRPFNELNDPSNQIYSESSNNGNILFVAPKSPEDEGTYQCVAENQFGKSFSNAAVVMERRRHGTPRVLDPSTSPIQGEPIIESVPENVPDFGLSREPKLVFYVYPTNQQETEDVEVINMLPASNVETETTDTEKEVQVNDVEVDQSFNIMSTDEIIGQTESPQVTAEKEKTINDIKSLLPGLLEESVTENDGLVETDENVADVETIIDELLDATEGSGDVDIEGILNSDPSGGLDLRSE